MKKLMMVFFTVIMLTACSNEISENKEYNFSIGMDNVSFINLPKTLDEVIYSHDYIVLASLDQIEQTQRSRINKVTVLEQYKGRDDLEGQTLDFYSVVNLTEVGQQYLLFLRERNVTFKPSKNYGSGIYPSPIVDGKLEAGPFAGESLKIIEKKIKASPQLKEYKNSVSEVKERAKDISELIELSDHIIHFSVIEVTQIGEFNTSVLPKVIAQYKSEELYEEGVNVSIPTFELPEEVNVGDEYLLFRALTPTVDGEELLLTTRFGSIISKQDSQKWEEALRLLKQ